MDAASETTLCGQELLLQVQLSGERDEEVDDVLTTSIWIRSSTPR